MTYVYAFDHKHRRPPMEYKDLLGGKGANLAEMTSVLKLPVPPGFTISTDACRAYMDGGWPEGLDEEIAKQVFKLEKAMGRKLGDPYDPLLVSVRSGAKFSMPGMMDTVLNLGLNDQSVEGLAARRRTTSGSRSTRTVASSRCTAASCSASTANCSSTRSRPPRRRRGQRRQRAAGIGAPRAVRSLQGGVEKATGAPFPQKPRDQLDGAVEAVFKSWNGARAIAYRVREKIDHDLGTAVNVQAMVFGNRDDNSGTGVGFTRNAATGENKPYGDFLVNAQGEDVVAGIRNTEDLDHMKLHFPVIHDELLAIFERLEAHYRDMCDTEFTIEQGKLWMLQTRVGKRTGAAALKMAVDMTTGTGKGRGQVEDHEGRGADPGERRAPRRRAAPAVRRGRQGPHHGSRGVAGCRGRRGVLHRRRGGCCRGAGREGRARAQRDEPRRRPRHDGRRGHPDRSRRARVARRRRRSRLGHAGDRRCRVGQDRRRAVHRRRRRRQQGRRHLARRHHRQRRARCDEAREAKPPPEFDVILKWADQVRKGKLAVRANADTGEDAANARRLGAEGIGLCRTEHMFLAPDRLPVVRKMILAQTEPEEEAALAELGRVQQIDFEEILEAMDGLPVTIRLLDPPLHEFLPSVEELRVKEAKEGLSKQEQRELKAAESWAEHNPMIGTRGVRLGVIKPGLYAMQVRALLAAAASLRQRGRTRSSRS